MRYQDDINTEHNVKSICRAAVAQWTKRLTRTGQTRVRIREAHIFDITDQTENNSLFTIIYDNRFINNIHSFKNNNFYFSILLMIGAGFFLG